MNSRPCCGRPSRVRRGLDVAGHVVPAAVLVLLPKCPACLVAWLAMGAGIGVTFSTAAYLRMLLLVVCVACLAYVAKRHVFRWTARRRASQRDLTAVT